MEPSQDHEAENTSVPNQHDTERDSLAIRADVIKHIAIVAGAIATISTTLLLIYLNESRPGSWFLVPGIIFLLLAIGISVFTLAHMAISVREPTSKIRGRTIGVFIAIYATFSIGFLCIIIFILVNRFHLFQMTRQNTPAVYDTVKMALQNYINDSVQTLQHNLSNLIMKDIKELSSQIDSKIHKATDDHNNAVKQHIDQAIDNHDKAMKQHIDQAMGVVTGWGIGPNRTNPQSVH